MKDLHRTNTTQHNCQRHLHQLTKDGCAKCRLGRPHPDWTLPQLAGTQLLCVTKVLQELNFLVPAEIPLV